MKIKCDFCGGMIEDTDPICPNCGAANEHMSRCLLYTSDAADEL